MAIYPHHRNSSIEVAFSWFGSRILTPAWFDDNEGALYGRHPRFARLNFRVWARLRSLRVIQRRYWGRS